jgi:hypothetical protein
MLKNVIKLKISEKKQNIRKNKISEKTQNIRNKTSNYLLNIDSDKHSDEKRGLALST